MASDGWGVQQHDLALDDVFKVDGRNHTNELSEYEAVIIGSNFGFPLDIAYEKIFVGGKTGSGKSYSAGVFMEELSRHGIQFVCFDGEYKLYAYYCVGPNDNYCDWSDEFVCWCYWGVSGNFF